MSSYFLQGWDLIDFDTVEDIVMWTAANGIAMHRSTVR